MGGRFLLLFLPWLALIVAGLAQLASGIVFLFNVFQNSLKATYNYTQSEDDWQLQFAFNFSTTTWTALNTAAVLASLSNFGVGTAFIPGLVYDKFGPLVTSFGGLFLSAGGYLLIWSTANFIGFYRDKSWLLGIYFYIGGIGSTFTYMASMNTSMINVSEKYRGTVCGVMNCCFSAGPTILIFVYYEFFVHGPTDIDSNHDYPGFMLTNAVVFGIINLLCVMFLRIYKKETKETNSDVTEMNENTFSRKKGSYQLNDVDKLNSAGGTVQAYSSLDQEKPSTADKIQKEHPRHTKADKTQEEHPPANEQKMSFIEQMKDGNFHLFAWLFGVSSAVGTVAMNNVTTTTKSMNQSSYDTYAVLVIPIFGVVVSILSGVFSDYLKSKYPRTYFLVLYNIMFIIAGILNTAWADQLVIFFISTGFIGIAMGIIWSITPTYLSELYGTQDFGRNWGIFLILSAILVFVMQQIFAALYDSKITILGEIVCYGFECVQSGYGVLLFFSTFSLILNILLIVCLARHNKQ